MTIVYQTIMETPEHRVARIERDQELARIANVGLQTQVEILPMRVAEEQPARSLLTTNRHTYGEHMPNYSDGMTDGMLRQFDKTLPTILVLMDNFKDEEGFVRCVEHLKRLGVLPKIIYRCYYPPAAPTPGVLGAYISKAIEKLGRLLRYAVMRELYDAGLLHIKLFNETNIGSEGFAKGFDGLTAANDAFLTVRAKVKEAFPKVIAGSIANTPGNADAHFRGDRTNVAYWYHGKLAADVDVLKRILEEIPIFVAQGLNYVIPSDLRTVVNEKSPMDEMFRMSDAIYYHVYAQNTDQVSGSLKTWYAQRHLVYQYFLQKYRGKKHYIPEFDAGYDEGLDARGRLVVYCHRTYFDPSPYVDGVCLWWNGAPNEGDISWTKHFTRDAGGFFFPVVNYVGEYRKGQGNPGPNPGPTPEPEPDPDPTRVLDPRLPALGVKLVNAVVAPGDMYWHIKEVKFQNEIEAGGRHSIYLDLLDEGGRRIVGGRARVTWSNGGADLLIEEKQGEEYGGSFPMYRSGNPYNLSGTGIPSDLLTGLGLGDEVNPDIPVHSAFLVKMQRRKMAIQVPLPQVQMKLQCDAAQVIQFNRKAAIQKAMFRLGYIPNSPEFQGELPPGDLPGGIWVMQRGETLDTGKVMYFGCPLGIYDIVYWTDGDAPLAPVPQP